VGAALRFTHFQPLLHAHVEHWLEHGMGCHKSTRAAPGSFWFTVNSCLTSNPTLSCCNHRRRHLSWAAWVPPWPAQSSR
jgi:hypothetical protein